MNKSIAYLLIILLSSSLLLTACGSREQKRELEKYVKDLREASKNNPTKPLLVELQLPKPVQYGNAPATETTEGPGGVKTNANSGKPLENYALKALQFVGTISENNQTWAYILTPDNMIYGAKEGDIIGNSYGKIVKITSDHIEVLEPSTESGGTKGQIVTLQLKE